MKLQIWFRWVGWIAAATALYCGLLPQNAGAGEPAGTEGPGQIALAFHVHSTMSTGALSLDELIDRAKAAGLDGVVLTENYRLRVDYGLWPFRGLLRYGVDYPSVMQRGAAEFIQAVDDAARRHPGFVIVPGVEIMPNYFWTGSLWTGDLTLNNTQRNLLVVGVDDAGGLSHLGDGASTPVPLWRRSAPFWLVFAFMVPAIWLWKYERVVTLRVRHFHLTQRRHYRRVSTALAVAGIVLLVNALAQPRTAVDPYAPDPGEVPAQRLIDEAQANGELVFWSLPEAKDYHRYSSADIGRELSDSSWLGRAGARILALVHGTVTVRTDPHPELLAKTHGYTGFGAIYQDHVRVTEPGAMWDRLLMDYMAGRRPLPVWGIGELAYHQEGHAGKTLNDVQTVLLADERSVASAMRALKSGAYYARRRDPAWALQLDDFTLRVPGRPGADAAISGQTLVLEQGGSAVLRLVVSATDGHGELIPVRVIRSAAVWQEFSATTPFQREWTIPPPEHGGHSYYRVEVGRGSQRLLSNPVFLVAQS